MAEAADPYLVKPSNFFDRVTSIDVTFRERDDVFCLSLDSADYEDGDLRGERVELRLDEGQLRVLEARIKDALFEFTKNRKPRWRAT